MVSWEASEEMGSAVLTAVLSGATDPRPVAEDCCTYKMAYYPSTCHDLGATLDEDLEAAEA